MTKPYRSHDEALGESLRADPAFAAEYLNAIIDDGDQAELMVALRQVADALGGPKAIGDQANLSNSIYRCLSPAGNPELRSFRKILGAMGLKLAIEPIRSEATAAA